MKKLIALVLCAALMSTVAAAAESYAYGTQYHPNTDITLGASDFGVNASDINDDNYSIKKVSYTSGKAYVDSVALDDDEGDELTIALKENYELDKYKTVEMTIDLRGKGSSNDDISLDLLFYVGYDVTTVAIGSDGDINGSDLALGTINKFDSGDEGQAYGILEFDADDDTSVSVRVYDGEQYFLNVNYDADKTLLVNNADSDAEISFLNFEGHPTFNSTATIYFYQVDEDGFIYQLTDSGKIAKSAAKWSEDDGCWVLKTRTLGSYVFSDAALTAVSSDASADADSSTANPDTGANDVVGIATALAVASLVAAGAVSLKK